VESGRSVNTRRYRRFIRRVSVVLARVYSRGQQVASRSRQDAKAQNPRISRLKTYRKLNMAMGFSHHQAKLLATLMVVIVLTAGTGDAHNTSGLLATTAGLLGVGHPDEDVDGNTEHPQDTLPQQAEESPAETEDVIRQPEDLPSEEVIPGEEEDPGTAPSEAEAFQEETSPEFWPYIIMPRDRVPPELAKPSMGEHALPQTEVVEAFAQMVPYKGGRPPTRCMYNCKPRRITLHWTAMDYNYSDKVTSAYHYNIDHRGLIHEGKYIPEHNVPRPDRGTLSPRDSYAPHTASENSYNIGIAVRGMLGYKNCREPGSYPLTYEAVESMAKLVAALAKKYDIPPTSEYIKTHYDYALIYGNRGPNRHKIDMTCLPFKPELGPKETYDYIMSRVQLYYNQPDLTITDYKQPHIRYF
jgi:hypothetical protein